VEAAGELQRAAGHAGPEHDASPLTVAEPEAAVRLDVADHVATVTIDRPPVNAVDTATLARLGDAFRSLGEDRDVRVAILTGAGGRSFVGGADLRTIDDDRAAGSPGHQLDRGLVAREAMWAISDCPVPVIGAINGPAIGAGLALAAVCDILLAADTATFGTTEINVGLLGASAHLSLLVGRHKARELFFTGELIGAEELHRLGAIRKVVPQGELADEARALAGVLAAKSPIALRLAKESMNRVEFLPLKDAYRTEQDYTARLLGFEDSAEARAAFLEKRDPDWKWR
jgi:enoyl-CoA hydratase